MLIYKFCKWAVAIFVLLIVGSMAVSSVLSSGLLWSLAIGVFIAWAVLGSLTSIGSLLK